MKKVFLRFLSKFLFKIYSPRVRSISKRTGLNNIFGQIYRLIDSKYSEVQVFAVRGTEFEVKTNSFLQAENLLGYLDEERKVIEHLLQNINDKDVFFDIGALYGPYSCLVAKYSPDAGVHAFEPGEERYKWLVETVERNNVNVETHKVGLGEKDKQIGLNTKGEPVSIKDANELIKLVNADDYINKKDIKPPTIVKIDVEGGELEVLEGLKQNLSQNVEHVYCEVHTNQGIRLDTVKNKLEGLGFETEILSRRGPTIHIYAN